ncbi:hypothetical protein RHGRI_002072 [Rhododendron griersonianum]|uniref:Uncharacterized protein n=1 Tax=Rhododendron griersonianum TaxID=479676 RepID=A0AAV6LQQ9_9ERIC|nr:hypothetical protein RHGRI_002072 [Rhododendron griersonianum]
MDETSGVGWESNCFYDNFLTSSPFSPPESSSTSSARPIPPSSSTARNPRRLPVEALWSRSYTLPFEICVLSSGKMLVNGFDNGEEEASSSCRDKGISILTRAPSLIGTRKMTGDYSPPTTDDENEIRDYDARCSVDSGEDIDVAEAEDADFEAHLLQAGESGAEDAAAPYKEKADHSTETGPSEIEPLGTGAQRGPEANVAERPRPRKRCRNNKYRAIFNSPDMVQEFRSSCKIPPNNLRSGGDKGRVEHLKAIPDQSAPSILDYVPSYNTTLTTRKERTKSKAPSRSRSTGPSTQASTRQADPLFGNIPDLSFGGDNNSDMTRHPFVGKDLLAALPSVANTSSWTEA